MLEKYYNGGLLQQVAETSYRSKNEEKDLAALSGVSKSTLAKTANNKHISTEIVSKICNVPKCQHRRYYGMCATRDLRYTFRFNYLIT